MFVYSKSFRGSTRMLSKALKHHPNEYNTLKNIALTLTKLNRFEESIKYFDLCIKICPEIALAFELKGNALLQLQDYKRAIICYNIAISLDPHCSNAKHNKSIALSFLNEYKDSSDEMSNDPKIKQSFLYNKGTTLFMSNRFNESIEYYDKCMSVRQGTESFKLALFQKTEALLRTDRFNEGLICANQQLKLDSRKKENFLVKGKILQQFSRFDEAVQVFDEAIQIDPNYIEAIGYRGHCLLKLYQFIESIEYCTRCIVLINKNGHDDPDFTSFIKENLKAAYKCQIMKQENKEKMDDFYKVLSRFDTN